MKRGMIYIHGKGGNAQEADHYSALFPDEDVVGFDYQSETPWEAMEEFPRFYDAFSRTHACVSIIANSIGAFFALHALGDKAMERAYFISPIVNMERLIADMMQWANVTEAELHKRGQIETAFGETLSWVYLCWVRSHPVSWRIPTRILYGSRDHLQSLDTIQSFAAQSGAETAVMEGGEHWFHTQEQMAFLDRWMLG
ncbi:MAG: alpha/beta hydrolase [Candidatus Ventricola sp.]